MHVITHGRESGTTPAENCPIMDLRGRTEEVLCTGPWLGMSGDVFLQAVLDVNEGIYFSEGQ